MALRPQVEIYCDGACLGNPGPGGWAALLRCRTQEGTVEKMLSGGASDTTNNRMELQGAISGLEALKHPCDVTLYCDSQYVVKGITSWMAGWKRKQWKKADGSPVLNEALWKALDDQCQRHRVQAQWVKGHAGHEENERVDQAARGEAEKIAAG